MYTFYGLRVNGPCLVAARSQGGSSETPPHWHATINFCTGLLLFMNVLQYTNYQDPNTQCFQLSNGQSIGSKVLIFAREDIMHISCHLTFKGDIQSLMTYCFDIVWTVHALAAVNICLQMWRTNTTSYICSPSLNGKKKNHIFTLLTRHLFSVYCTCTKKCINEDFLCDT